MEPGEAPGPGKAQPDRSSPKRADLQSLGFGMKVDAIFEEVENNLPSIDFDISDVSSDEDVTIFQRTIRTPTFDEDKDLDESLTNRSWEQLLKSHHEAPDNDIMAAHSLQIRLNAGTDPRLLEESSESVDQQLTAEIDQCGVSTLSLRSISEVENEVDVEGPAEVHLSSPSVQSTGTSTMSVQTGGEPLKINTWVKTEPSTGSNSNDTDKSNTSLSLPLDNHEKDKNTSSSTPKVMPKDVVSQYIPAMAPSLTFQDLDNIDLDAALGASGEPRMDNFPSHRRETTPVSADASNRPQQQDNAENVSLIEKLARLTVVQSGERMAEYNPQTGALAHPSQGDKEQSISHRSQPAQTAQVNAPNLKAIKTARNRDVEAQQKNQSQGGASSMAFGAGFVPPWTGSRQGKIKDDEPQRETIFIDLRNFDVEKHQQQLSFEAVQRILRLAPQQGEEDSSSEDEEAPSSNTTLWHEQRRQMKAALSAGKSIQESTTTKIEGSKESVDEAANTESSGDQSKTDLKQVAPISDKATRHSKLPVGTSPSSKINNVTSQPKDSATPPQESSVPTDKQKQKKIDAARKAREAREAEHQSRLRLGQRLEAVRPTTTCTERQAAAEATPCVFDLEASYEPAPESLLKEISKRRDLVLLTVHLACNGEITLHRDRANRSVDSGHGLSASYTTLVTWMLSLVPDDFSFLHSSPCEFPSAQHADVSGVPFHVVAMQQMVLNDQMALYIAVCPSEPGSTHVPKMKKTKKRDDFRSVLVKFFSTHTLHTVCPWLQDLVSMEVTSRLSESTQPFIYRPPLPNITNKPLSTFIQINDDGESVSRIFSLQIGFFWHTMETEDTLADLGYQGPVPPDEGDTQNTMSLIYKKIYRDPRATLGILSRLLQEGLDLAGLRLLYPTTALMTVAASTTSPSPPSSDSSSEDNQLNMLNKIGPLVALALRGTFARTIWLDAVGPADPVLARRTDPNSLGALYGGNSREESLLFCPRSPERIQAELARWFGGRVPASGVVNIGTGHTRKRPGSGKKTKGSKSSASDSCPEPGVDFATHNPPSMLTATIKSHVILLLSPLVPTKCLGLVLATCQRRGYQVCGVRRLRLTKKRTGSLGLTGVQVPAFTEGSNRLHHASRIPHKQDSTLDPAAGDGPTATFVPPSTVLLLTKENGLHNASSLIEALMVQMCLLDLLGPIQEAVDEPLTSSLLFHALPHSDAYIATLGRDFHKVPEGDRVIAPGYIAPRLHTNPEMEQIAVVALIGHQAMKNFGLLLGRLVGVVPFIRSNTSSPVSDAFELLAIKWLPALSQTHAKELTPHEVGAPQWKSSIQALTSEPAVIFALRGINAFSRLDTFLKSTAQPKLSPRSVHVSLERLVSPSPDIAYRQMALFFWDREIFPDPSARKMLQYLPPARPHRASDHSEKLHLASESSDETQEESIFDIMLSGPMLLVTVLVAKPDVVRRHLGKLLRRVSQDGFSLVGFQLKVLTEEEADRVIPEDDLQNEVLRGMHQSYLTSAPSAVFALQRENAIYRLHQQLGPADPQVARRLGQHYWRSVFGSDAIVNGLHGSNSYVSAIRDVHTFFPDGLACSPTCDLEAEGIVCPVEDTIIDVRPTRSVVISEQPDQAPLPIATTRSSGTSTVDWTLPRSTLTETNCILLMPSLLKKKGTSRRAAYVEVMEALSNNSFDLVAGRLVWLTEYQAEHYLCLLNAGNFQLVPFLTSGPSLLLVIQRDNATIAFDSLMGTSYVKDSIYAKYGSQILRPKDVKQAHKHLAFFFDKLCPGAQLKIVSKSSNSEGN